jgi:2-polyprenyl-3-methyl-5-hydroxy-6-metoxy-1,4-benzoquinol methylase
MKEFKDLKKCLCCDSTNLRIILDLIDQPLANSYHNNYKSLNKYPLKLNLCSNCWHLQLSHIINPDLMFKNYLYVSGTTKTLRDYFEWFANFTLTYFPKARNILDIACNDGSQLNEYKKMGLSTYGIDPAINLSDISIKNGHNIIVDYFNDNSIKKLNGEKMDLILAQNVFAHNSYPLKFLKSCKKILNNDGYIFIQTSQSDMVVNNEFDTIYHEHISFFSINSMKILIERSGLILHDVIKTDIHGNSFVFIISKNKNNKLSNISNLMLEFENSKLNSVFTYIQYAYNAHKIVSDLKDIIIKYKKEGYHIIGYGAAAKGNTLLNFGDIELDVIVDDNPLKHNLYTPGKNIKITSPSYISSISNDERILFIPLSWNFFKEIKIKINNQRNNSNDLFIKYFPTIQLINND